MPESQLLLYPWQIDTDYINNIITSVTICEINHNMKTSNHSSWISQGCILLRRKKCFWHDDSEDVKTFTSGRFHCSYVTTVSIFELISEKSHVQWDCRHAKCHQDLNGGQISAQNSSKYFKQLLLDFRKEVKKSRLLVTNDLLLSDS